MSKSKKQLLRELLELEDEALGEDRLPEETTKPEVLIIPETINAVQDDEPLTKPKKQLTQKQLDALKKGQQKRDENRVKNKTEKEKREAEDKKLLEDKLVKKAIALKKKQIKKQALLDEISDDETPIQKIKAIAAGNQGSPTTPPLPQMPVIRFV